MSAKNWFKFLLLGMIWGSSFLWIKFALQEVGPFTLVMFRTGFAFIALTVVWLIFRSEMHKKDLWKFVILGFFNVALPFVMISWAEQHISSGMAAILNSTVPLFTIMIAPAFIKEERFTARIGLGLLVGFAGVVILASKQFGAGDSLSGLGIVAMLAAACSYACSTIFARKATTGMRVDAQSVGQMGLAFAFLLPSTMIAEPPLHFPTLPLTYAALLWLGIIGSSVATLLYYSLLNSVGPTRTSMATYMFPLVGVLLGLIFLRETLDWRVLVGGILVIIAVVIVNSRVKVDPDKLTAVVVNNMENENG